MTSRNSNKSSYLPDQIEWNVPNSIETYDGTANDCAVSVLTGEHFDGDLNCPNEKSHNNNTTIDNNKEKKADPLEIKEVKKSDSDDSHPCTNSTSSGTTPQDATIMSCYDTFSRTWTRTVRSFQRPIRKTMASVAVWSASHPLFVVVLSLSLSICLMVTGYFTNFVMIEDEVQLWGMQGSMLLKDREWVKNVFVPASREDDANYVTILVHKNGDNVITKDGMRTVLNILDRVRNNNDTGYQDFCGKYGSNLCTPRRSLTCILSGISIEPPTITCPIYGLTTAWLHNTTIFETMVESDDDVRLFFKSSYVALNSDDKPWTLDLESFVSFPEFHADTLVAAKSLTTHIRLPREYSNRANERDVISQEATMLEKNIIKTLQQLHLEWEGDFAFEFHSSLYDEFHRDIFREILLLPVLFIVLVLLTALLSCKHSDRGFSQIFLGIGSVICVASSVLSGYGIMFVIGVPFTYLALASVFVVFVVGLVDAFVIYNAFLQTDVKENVLERTYKSMEEAGMGIFISSTTAIIAFSIGALSNIQVGGYRCVCSAWRSTFTYPMFLVHRQFDGYLYMLSQP
jgi:Niemann-Pick C1 protein